MSGRSRFLLATLCGLVLAGIAHIVAVLVVPWLGERDALERLAGAAAADHAVVVQAAGEAAPDAGLAPWLPQPDPAVAVAACAFNLEEGPVRVAARMGPLFESLSVHARGAGAVYAVTDQAAVRGALDLVILTQGQLDEILARDEENEGRRDVRVVAPSRQGFVTVRVLAGLPSERAAASEAARSVSCTVDAPPEP